MHRINALLSIVSLIASGCAFRWDIVKVRQQAPPSEGLADFPVLGGEQRAALHACEVALKRENKRGDNLSRAAESLLWVDLGASVATTTLTGFASTEAPGTGASSVAEAVSAQEKLSRVEIAALSVGVVTAVSAGATTLLAALRQKQSERAQHVAKLIDELAQGSTPGKAELTTYCNFVTPLAGDPQ